MIRFFVLIIGEVKLVVMVFLINFVVVLCMDFGFGVCLKSLVVMGGNMYGMFFVEVCVFWEIIKYCL